MTSAFPEIIEIELTSRCNKKCIMCQRQWMDFTNVRGDLSVFSSGATHISNDSISEYDFQVGILQ